VHAIFAGANGTLSAVYIQAQNAQAFAELAGIDVVRDRAAADGQTQTVRSACGVAEFALKDGEPSPAPAGRRLT